MKLTPRSQCWAIVLIYVLFIYATLGVTGIPLAFLRAHGVLRLSLFTAYMACLYLSLHILLKFKGAEWWRYALLLGVYGVALWVATSWVKIPEEQVHFFEYGLVGILFA